MLPSRGRQALLIVDAVNKYYRRVWRRNFISVPVPGIIKLCMWIVKFEANVNAAITCDARAFWWPRHGSLNANVALDDPWLWIIIQSSTVLVTMFYRKPMSCKPDPIIESKCKEVQIILLSILT